MVLKWHRDEQEALDFRIRSAAYLAFLIVVRSVSLGVGPHLYRNPPTLEAAQENSATWSMDQVVLQRPDASCFAQHRAFDVYIARVGGRRILEALGKGGTSFSRGPFHEERQPVVGSRML